MSRIEIEGMQRLQGEVTIQGSKNAVLPILSACVLNEGETILHGCPKIQDVFSMLEAIACAGAKYHWEDHTLILDTSVMHSAPLIEKAGSMRSSVMLLGSFLARFGRATLGYPGGCCIGKRPIDLHEQVLAAMGATFLEEKNYLEAKCESLSGCELYLPYPSVGVTENILLAASKAAGFTRVFGAAREPEIMELCKFLRAMGVFISGEGTGKLWIQGGKLKKTLEYTLCKDRIVAGTYLMAVVITGGEVCFREVPLEHMKSTMKVIGMLGAHCRKEGNALIVSMKEKPRGISYLCTAPYPGFPTDLQSPLLATLCYSGRNGWVEEQIFENRFLIVEELKKMGANIEVHDRKVLIIPENPLYGANVTARDLRGGAALVLAGLGAEGNTVVENLNVIERGYEAIEKDLGALGANIRIFS
ncbi:MAG: UDP-N-acetylglucosamine 1-carboxyvinyltransferase [Lachnospiraceae bacterium]|nr:UDP-N-acetylglucosamine 1-carboxyvinyltransferase [Lachnospiraceae bacterium]